MAEQTEAAPSTEAESEIENLGGETPPADPPEDDGEVIVTIGEAAPAAEEEDETKAAPWIRELRKTNREQARELRELRQKAAAPANEPVAVPKPTLEACDYDTEAFERKYEAWQAQQSQAAEEKRKKDDAQKAADDAWQARMASYTKAKSELKVSDFEDAEEVVASLFSVTQRGIIINGSDSHALVVYAIGKNPEKAKELAAISDPVKFCFAVAKLETQLKVTPRKIAPPPERRINGNSGVGGSADQNLDKLRAEAQKTGDMSKVVAYNRQLKQKAKAA